MDSERFSKLTRRSFLFGLAGVITLRLPQDALAATGLFDPFSFAFISDVHLATGQTDTDILLQESQLFLQDVVKTLNEEKVDFVIFGGDQVETPGKDDSNWQLFLDVAQSLTAPWTFVLGEKDVSGARVVDKMKTYGPDWTTKGIKTEKPYWSQTPLPGVHFIGLDTSRANTTRGELSDEQLEWLKADLAKNKSKFTIVFSHHPLLPPPPFDSGPPWEDYVTPQGATAREILNSSKYVRLAMSGHVHLSKIQQERDIWYVSNPSVSLYPCSFRIIHVNSEAITIETYQVAYPALVKKARQVMSNSPIAFKYNARKPDTFAELAEGTRLDQNAELPLTPGAAIQPLKASKQKSEPRKNVEEPKKKIEEPKKKVEESKPRKPEIDEKSEAEKSKPEKHFWQRGKQKSEPVKDKPSKDTTAKEKSPEPAIQPKSETKSPVPKDPDDLIPAPVDDKIKE